MTSLLAIIFTIAVIVFIHELGHFLFARLFGVTVEKFSIGFPPVVYKKKVGETEYSIGMIPLGGYVKMKGIIDESLDESTLTGAPDEFASKKNYQKILILLGGVLFNLIFAYFIFTSVIYLKGKTVFPGTTIGIVDSSSVGFRAGLRMNDRIVKINDQPVKNWEEISTIFLQYLGRDMVFTVSRGDSEVQVNLPAEYFREKDSEYLGVGPKLLPVIGTVQPGSPADKAGLRPGDRITHFNGHPVDSWYQLTDSIRKYPDQAVTLRFLRDGEETELTVTPRSVFIKNENGIDREIGQLGISMQLETIEYSLGKSFIAGFEEVKNQIMLNVNGLLMLIRGTRSAKEMVGGPIAIVQMVSSAADFGFVSLLRFIGALNIILAIFNVLPIPALDGGHIVLVLIEAMRRKPLSLKTRIRIQQIGFVILIALMTFAIFADISRLF